MYVDAATAAAFHETTEVYSMHIVAVTGVRGSMLLIRPVHPARSGIYAVGLTNASIRRRSHFMSVSSLPSDVAFNLPDCRSSPQINKQPM